MVPRSFVVAATVFLVASASGCSIDIDPPAFLSGPGQVDSAATTWLNANSRPLAALEPGGTTLDLDPLKTMIGNATIVAMGTDTHGDHESFGARERVFEYLVAQMGFTSLAIEAPMAESFAIDDYVRTGRGDPAALLSRMHSWTWNTAEMLDLVQWIRAHNVSLPTAQQVGFAGIDVSYNAVAIDSVLAYVANTIPALSQSIIDDYACLRDYRNDTLGVWVNDYSQATSVWPSCSIGVGDAYNVMVANRSALEAASSADRFARALQMARVVVQWEKVERGDETTDLSMAQNIGWVLSQTAVQPKMFVWAHDAHVARSATASTESMGAYLASVLPASYLPVGFAFGAGSFNATPPTASGAVASSFSQMTTTAPRVDSYEEVLQSSKYKNYYFDMRVSTTQLVTEWLVGPEWFRNVGSSFDPDAPDTFFQAANLSSLFDIVFFVNTVTPSHPL